MHLINGCVLVSFFIGDQLCNIISFLPFLKTNQGNNLIMVVFFNFSTFRSYFYMNMVTEHLTQYAVIYSIQKTYDILPSQIQIRIVLWIVNFLIFTFNFC